MLPKLLFDYRPKNLYWLEQPLVSPPPKEALKVERCQIPAETVIELEAFYGNIDDPSSVLAAKINRWGHLCC